MKITFSEAVDADLATRLIYFTALKHQALEKAQEHLRRSFGGGVSLKLIDKKAVNAILQTWRPVIKESEQKAHIDNRSISYNLRSTSLMLDDYSVDSLKEVKGLPFNYTDTTLDMAIWMEEQLCGLAIGGCNTDDKTVWVESAEGSPNYNHPLRGDIASIIDIAYSYYANEYGIDKVMYLTPYSAGAEVKLKEMGLDLEAGYGSIVSGMKLYVRRISDIIDVEKAIDDGMLFELERSTGMQLPQGGNGVLAHKPNFE